VTKGEQGVDVIVKGSVTSIPAIKAQAVVDPTGCGDAFRSGFLFGLSRGMDVIEAARIGCIMGAIKIAHHGGQNYQTGWAEVSAMLARHYPG
jgi:adenosine kinase